jgi:hypothetical protein
MSKVNPIRDELRGGTEPPHAYLTSIPPDAAFDGLVAAALEIATRDATIRRELKDALFHDDLARALRCACALVGVEPTPAILQLERAP